MRGYYIVIDFIVHMCAACISSTKQPACFSRGSSFCLTTIRKIRIFGKLFEWWHKLHSKSKEKLIDRIVAHIQYRQLEVVHMKCKCKQSIRWENIYRTSDVDELNTVAVSKRFISRTHNTLLLLLIMLFIWDSKKGRGKTKTERSSS